MTQEIARPHECELEVAAFIAAQNWEHWQDCFNACPKELPIYKCPERFKEFVRGYGLLRGESREKQRELQSWMPKNDRVRRLTDREDGSGVESLLDEMKDCGFNRHRSFLSKIAAFSRPDVFIAYDSYARKGLVKLGAAKKEPQDYVKYLKKVRKLQCAILQDIERHLENRDLPPGNCKAFQLRVLDVHLMMSGEREIRPTSDELLKSLKRNPSRCRLF